MAKPISKRGPSNYLQIVTQSLKVQGFTMRDYMHRVPEAVGPVAQVVEQLTFNQWVEGSNPSGLTIVYLCVFCLLTAVNSHFSRNQR